MLNRMRSAFKTIAPARTVTYLLIKRLYSKSNIIIENEVTYPLEVGVNIDSHSVSHLYHV